MGLENLGEIFFIFLFNFLIIFTVSVMLESLAGNKLPVKFWNVEKIGQNKKIPLYFLNPDQMLFKKLHKSVGLYPLTLLRYK